MDWLRPILHELIGLFIDDELLALAAILWVGIVWLVLPHVVPAGTWRAATLFVGLAAILVASTWRAAGRRRR